MSADLLGEEGWRHVAAGVCVGIALCFLVIGALGAVRFGDVYERLHAVRAAALGAPVLLAGLAIETWDWRLAVKLGLLGVLLAVTGPSLAHLIAHAAHRAGIEPGAKVAARRPPATDQRRGGS